MDVLVLDVVHDTVELVFAVRDPLLDEAQRVSAQVELVDDLIDAHLYFGSELAVVRTDGFLPL